MTADLLDHLVWPPRPSERSEGRRAEIVGEIAEEWCRLNPAMRSVQGLERRQSHAITAGNVKHLLDQVLPDETFLVLRVVNLDEQHSRNSPGHKLKVTWLEPHPEAPFPADVDDVFRWFLPLTSHDNDLRREAFQAAFGVVQGINILRRGPTLQERNEMVQKEAKRLLSVISPASPCDSSMLKPRL